jgi:hypothetical protein
MKEGMTDCDYTIVRDNGQNKTKCRNFQGCLFKSNFIPPKEMRQSTEDGSCADPNPDESLSGDSEEVYF